LLADNGGVPGAVVFSQNHAGQVPTNSNSSFTTLADDFMIRSNDTLQIDVNLNNLTADLLSVGAGGLGDLVLQSGSTLEVFVTGPGSPHTFNILDFGTVTGAFSTINVFGLPANVGIDFSQLLINGTITVSPEPASVAIWSLFAVGLGVYVLRRRRR
jgi:MYXO-CTERM domain-containing protein